MKNCKGVIGNLLKIILWTVVFILLSASASYAINKIIN